MHNFCAKFLFVYFDRILNACERVIIRDKNGRSIFNLIFHVVTDLKIVKDPGNRKRIFFCGVSRRCDKNKFIYALFFFGNIPHTCRSTGAQSH